MMTGLGRYCAGPALREPPARANWSSSLRNVGQQDGAVAEHLLRLEPELEACRVDCVVEALPLPDDDRDDPDLDLFAPVERFERKRRSRSFSVGQAVNRRRSARPKGRLGALLLRLR